MVGRLLSSKPPLVHPASTILPSSSWTTQTHPNHPSQHPGIVSYSPLEVLRLLAGGGWACARPRHTFRFRKTTDYIITHASTLPDRYRRLFVWPQNHDTRRSLLQLCDSAPSVRPLGVEFVSNVGDAAVLNNNFCLFSSYGN